MSEQFPMKADGACKPAIVKVKEIERSLGEAGDPEIMEASRRAVGELEDDPALRGRPRTVAKTAGDRLSQAATAAGTFLEAVSDTTNRGRRCADRPRRLRCRWCEGGCCRQGGRAASFNGGRRGRRRRCRKPSVVSLGREPGLDHRRFREIPVRGHEGCKQGHGGGMPRVGVDSRAVAGSWTGGTDKTPLRSRCEGGSALQGVVRAIPACRRW